VLRDALLAGADQDASRLAFAHGDARVSLGELTERAASRAAALHGMGVRPCDRVAMKMAAGIPFVEVFWALQLLGAVPCAFNPHAPATTLTQRIARINPALVITDAIAAEMAHCHTTVPDPELAPDDLAFLQLTSGTSGEPRASMIRHRNIAACLRQTEGIGYMTAGDVLVAWVPPWHDLGLVRFVIEPVWRRLPCHIVAPAVRTIGRWLTTISEAGGTWTAGPDFAYRLAARMVDPATVNLSTLRVALSGGEPVRASSIEQFEQRFATPGVIRPGYGLGEATLGVATTLPGEAVRQDARGNVSCGRPLPGVEVRAGDSLDAPAEIRVRGEAVFAGYLDAPEDTARALRDGWLHTGDSGYLDEQNRLFVLGRRSGMIKRAGALIAPRELEEAAQRVDGVRIAAAAVVPGPGLDDGETIVVAVEIDRAAVHSEQEIAAAVSREIEAALGFAPGRVAIVAPRTIPRTENGKVRHDALAESLRTLRLG
jgi:fatty-acyl-CoA synthase